MRRRATMTKRIDEPTGTETVGHEWDGIEELDTPMPRWWLWTFYASIVFAIGYVIALSGAARDYTARPRERSVGRAAASSPRKCRPRRTAARRCSKR